MKENIKEIFSVLKEWRKKILVIIGSYLKEFKKNWVFFTFVLVLFSSATVCLHVGTAKTFSGREEFFHERIAAIARENEEQTVLMNVKPNEYDKELLKQVVNKYTDTNYHNVFVDKKNINRVYYTINSDSLMCFDSKKVTMIFPNVFSSKEVMLDDDNKSLRYKMDAMDLYYFEKPTYNTNGANDWCVISSNFAEKLMNDRNLDSINEVVGEIIAINININNQLTSLKLAVTAIYDSNMGEAENIEKMYGDVVLSYFFHSAISTKYEDISIDVRLYHDTVSNKKTIYYFNQYYNLNNSNISFYSGETYSKNSNLEEMFVNLFEERGINFTEIYIACILYLLLLVLTVYHLIFSKNVNQDNINKNLGIIISLIILILGIIEIVLSNMNCAKIYKFSHQFGIYSSIASLYSLLIIPIIFVIFIIKIINEKKKVM